VKFTMPTLLFHISFIIIITTGIYFIYFKNKVRLDSSVGIANGYRLDDRGAKFDSR
jgi:hypothetical protein